MVLVSLCIWPERFTLPWLDCPNECSASDACLCLCQGADVGNATGTESLALLVVVILRRFQACKREQQDWNSAGSLPSGNAFAMSLGCPCIHPSVGWTFCPPAQTALRQESLIDMTVRPSRAMTVGSCPPVLIVGQQTHVTAARLYSSMLYTMFQGRN